MKSFRILSVIMLLSVASQACGMFRSFASRLMTRPYACLGLAGTAVTTSGVIAAANQEKPAQETASKGTSVTREYNNWEGEKVGVATVSTSENGGSITYKPYKQDARKKDVVFKAVSVLKCHPNNKSCNKRLQHMLTLKGNCGCSDSCSHTDPYPTYSHPFMHSGLPYVNGNGGLLNPVLREYRSSAEKVDSADAHGVRVEISGRVGADGIAPYKFDKNHYGEKHDPKEKYIYEPTILEEVLLGAVKERATDRQLSDLTARWFPENGGNHSEKFRQCVKHVFTSKKDEADSGQIAPECQDLIQRHFPRSVYWPSRWTHDRLRSGEYDRWWFFLGEKSKDDSVTKIELTDLDVSVEDPANKEKWAQERVQTVAGLAALAALAEANRSN